MSGQPSQESTLANAAFYDPTIFATEQRAIGDRYWVLLGPAEWVAQDGAWMTGRIGDRDVFVQRFGERLVGFENVCSHRFSELRKERRGVGPIKCPYHGWMFNAEGVPVGIPHCREMFGVAPHQLADRRLRRIAVQASGALVFGHLLPDTSDGVGAGFGRWGALFSALAHMELVWAPERVVKANWKLVYENTLDDYHIETVHPSNFGSSGGHPPGSYRYEEDDGNSAMVTRRQGIDSVDADQVIRALAEGTSLPVDYAIFHFFPDLTVDIVAGRAVAVARYQALSPEETLLRGFLFDFVPPGGRPLSAPRREYFQRLFGRITDEDFDVVERWNRGLKRSSARRLHGKQELRIGHFERSWAKLFAAGEADVTGGQQTRVQMG